MAQRRAMTISPAWLQVAILTFLLGFAVLGYLARRIATDHPPIPVAVQDTAGTVLFTGDDIMAGQNPVPALRADAVRHDVRAWRLSGAGFHRRDPASGRRGDAAPSTGGRGLRRRKRQARVHAGAEGECLRPAIRGAGLFPRPGARLHRTGRLLQALVRPRPPAQQGLRRSDHRDPGEIHRLTAFFSWAAWTTPPCAPAAAYSYTNNWPPEPLAGNSPTAAGAPLERAQPDRAAGRHRDRVCLSSAATTGSAGTREDDRAENAAFPAAGRSAPHARRSAPRRGISWWWPGCFCCQGLLGGVNAHYHVEPGGFLRRCRSPNGCPTTCRACGICSWRCSSSPPASWPWASFWRR